MDGMRGYFCELPAEFAGSCERRGCLGSFDIFPASKLRAGVRDWANFNVFGYKVIGLIEWIFVERALSNKKIVAVIALRAPPTPG